MNALAALALISCTLLQIPSADKPIEKQNPTSNKSNNASGQKNKHLPSTVSTATVPHQINSHQQENDDPNPPKDRIYDIKVKEVPPADYWVRSYVVITGILAALNIAGLFLVWHQRNVMKGQLVEMGKQTCIAISTARTAENHYQIMRNAERPLVLIEKIELNKFEAQEKLHCSVFVKNYGRTPAFLTEHKFIFRLMRSVPKAPLEYSPFPFEFQQEVITPNTPARVWVPLHEERLTLRQFEAVKNRSEFLYVFGFFKYRDGTRENEYETCFFQVYDIPVLKGFEFMPTGPVEYNQVK
jgi:hypothetical protein